MEQDRSNWLASLYDSNYDRLYHIAFRLTGCEDVSEELVHDAFVLALSHSEILMAHPHPEAWLSLTVKNLCKNENRRHSLIDASAEKLFQVAAPEPDRGIRELLPKELSDKDKQILIWRFEEDLDYKKIADLLGVSATVCRSRVFRALARCRELLKENGFPL